MEHYNYIRDRGRVGVDEKTSNIAALGAGWEASEERGVL